MILFLWILILLLVIIILLLSIALKQVIKRATYLSRKEKDFIEFAIDMYVDYGEELEIHDPEQHELIVEQLKIIKDKKINKDANKKT